MKYSLKLKGNILTLTLDNTKSFQEQKADIKEYFENMQSFLYKGKVRFSYEGVTLTFEEEAELCSMADEAFGYKVDFCHKQNPPEWMIRHILSNGERILKKVTKTLRSGECIVSNGDVVIIGDVNPAAQIEARGDIYVIGNLRGVAHAGCEGDEKAVVYAMKMNPVMIKIADTVGFNDNLRTKNQNGIAMIENGEIKVKLI